MAGRAERQMALKEMQIVGQGRQGIWVPEMIADEAGSRAGQAGRWKGRERKRNGREESGVEG